MWSMTALTRVQTQVQALPLTVGNGLENTGFGHGWEEIGRTLPWKSVCWAISTPMTICCMLTNFERSTYLTWIIRVSRMQA